MSEARFDWFEKVQVATASPAKVSIDGKFGAVLGRAQDDDGRWSYGVFVYDEKAVWSCCEDELAPTGEFDQSESFFGGESIRVSSRGEVLGSPKQAEPNAASDRRI